MIFPFTEWCYKSDHENTDRFVIVVLAIDLTIGEFFYRLVDREEIVRERYDTASIAAGLASLRKRA